jgi:hypothetical protein
VAEVPPIRPSLHPHPSGTTAFLVDGRVNEKGRKIPFILEIENNYLLRCTNSAGFLFSACIADVGNEPITCVLADGTAIDCVMVIDRSRAKIRLNARNAGWFLARDLPKVLG